MRARDDGGGPAGRLAGPAFQGSPDAADAVGRDTGLPSLSRALVSAARGPGGAVGPARRLPPPERGREPQAAGTSKVASPCTILVLNGPNLNMLGAREPEVYGTATLEDIRDACRARAGALGAEADFRQTNSEAELVGWIQEARGSAAAIVINPAALTHTSVAVMDALSLAGLPVVEVHISNILRREPFRRRSYVSRVATGVISGLGAAGYPLAVEAAVGLAGAPAGAGDAGAGGAG